MRLTRWITLLVILESTAFGNEWVKATIKSSGASLHQQADATSPALGKYPAGTRITVYSPSKNGFYAIYFAQAWKNLHYVWVSENEIEVEHPVAQTPKGSRHRSISSIHDDEETEHTPNSIRVGITSYFFSPSALQTALGDTPSSILSIGFNAAYERKLTDKFSLWGSLSYFSFTKSLAAAGLTDTTYSVSGQNFMVGAGYYLVNKNPFSLSANLGVGFSVSTAGDTTTVKKVSTSGITSFPLLVNVTGNYNINKNFGAFLTLGYQIQSLSGVSVYLPFSTTQATPDISLSSLLVSLGLSYRF